MANGHLADAASICDRATERGVDNAEIGLLLALAGIGEVLTDLLDKLGDAVDKLGDVENTLGDVVVAVNSINLGNM